MTNFNKNYRELLQRSYYITIAAFCCFILCYEYSYELLYLVIKPLLLILKEEQNVPKIVFIFTDLSESFKTHFKISLVITFFMSIILSAIQIWMYICPMAIKKDFNELNVYLIVSFIIFSISSYWIFFKIVPILWKFFLSFEKNNTYNIFTITLQAKILTYLNTILSILYIFSTIILLFIIINIFIHKTKSKKIPTFLKQKRKYIYLLNLFFAALLSPPDILSQIVFSLPLLICSELTIINHIILTKYLEETGFEPALE